MENKHLELREICIELLRFCLPEDVIGYSALQRASKGKLELISFLGRSGYTAFGMDREVDRTIRAVIEKVQGYVTSGKEGAPEAVAALWECTGVSRAASSFQYINAVKAANIDYEGALFKTELVGIIEPLEISEEETLLLGLFLKVVHCFYFTSKRLLLEYEISGATNEHRELTEAYSTIFRPSLFTAPKKGSQQRPYLAVQVLGMADIFMHVNDDTFEDMYQIILSTLKEQFDFSLEDLHINRLRAKLI